MLSGKINDGRRIIFNKAKNRLMKSIYNANAPEIALRDDISVVSPSA